MKNKRIPSFLILVLLLATFSAILPGLALAHTAGDPYVTDLIAGQFYDVGDVYVWNDGSNLYVKYKTSAGYYMSETHLAVETSLDDIPQKNGNPPPGQFQYSSEHDPMVDELIYTIPITWDVGEELFIAAHAVVCWGGISSIELELPEQVTMQVSYPYPGGPSYFPVVTVSGGTTIDGTYEGWCVDTDEGIPENTPYTADVYSSYEALPVGKIEYPENLDLVNWIINQDYVGQTSPGGYGTYTYGDVQRAIWELVEDEQSEEGLGDWSQARVDEILADASANGEGYTPGCGDEIVIILNPVGEVAQIVIITIPVPCPGCETAWGDGFDFPGRNWAMYFTYTIQ